MLVRYRFRLAMVDRVRAKYPKPRLRVRRAWRRLRARRRRPTGRRFRGSWSAGPRSPCTPSTSCSRTAGTEAIVWSERADELGWLAVHNQAFERLGGVPAVVRVDNTRRRRSETASGASRRVRIHRAGRRAIARPRTRAPRSSTCSDFDDDVLHQGLVALGAVVADGTEHVQLRHVADHAAAR